MAPRSLRWVRGLLIETWVRLLVAIPLSALTPAPVKTTILFLLLLIGVFNHVSKVLLISLGLTSIIVYILSRQNYIFCVNNII